MAEEERIAALESRVRMLEGHVASLVERIEQLQGQRDSMRGLVRCPACGGRRLVRARQVADRDSGQLKPMAVSTKGMFFPEPCGVFEIDVCAACGLVEWHVDDPSKIDIEHPDIHVITSEGDGPGPYR